MLNHIQLIRLRESTVNQIRGFILEGTRKPLSRDKQAERESLEKRISKDPYMTIQLRESSVEKLRSWYVDVKGEGNGFTYDNVICGLIDSCYKNK